ncbi:lysylphosphatidylglycerol synthase domain-containing protein [Plastoroseomonas arctica]|uniref:Lysylphosphatidylglycerol synthetase family protein n=1 Tax=Plastoroseomonas arctica TaxID=1509237 RepID=A0AAF1KID7_9PROT|nr:lysylphosphatidylglycerol synthase domain-containing protein [Plastoroseomonas arctica]MBR0654809.1 lysylphosphatidylglycerol synthetase family protein [Plastoroseomonas arctica]
MSAAWPLLRRHGPTAFGLALLVGAIYVVQREFRGLSVADIGTALAAIPPSALWIAGGLTLVAFAVLTIYDRLGSVYAGHPVSYARTSLASFVSYTLAHNLGFAAVSGAAVRYRFYAAWGLTSLEIAKIVAFTSLTYGLGGFALGGLVLMVQPDILPWFRDHVPSWAMRVIAIVLWTTVLTYVVLSRLVSRIRIFGHDINLPGLKMALAQVALASVDVAVTAAIFYTLLPAADGLTFIIFLGIYVAGYTAGIAASVPGGIGVFDGFMLLALQPYMPPSHAVGALLLFRLYYYIIPLFVAGGLFAAFELTQRRAALGKLTANLRGGEALEAPALASLIGLGGTVLIFVGALPVKGTLMEEWAGPTAAIASHFAASVVGSLLLLIGYGMVRRLRVAMQLGLLLLLNGAAILWLRGEAWWLWGAFLLVFALLAATRSAFYRDARLLSETVSAETTLALGAVAACAITLALVAYDGAVADASWWQVVLSAAAPDSLRFTVGLSAILLLVALLRLLRPARNPALAYTPEVRERLASLGAEAPPEADGAVFGEAGVAGLAFLKRSGVWLALGDPGGETRDRISAIWRFRDLCESARVDPAFWRVGPELQRVYADIGLTAFPMVAAPGAPPSFIACRAEHDIDNLRLLLRERQDLT